MMVTEDDKYNAALMFVVLLVLACCFIFSVCSYSSRDITNNVSSTIFPRFITDKYDHVYYQKELIFLDL
jgi:hypothetical protein